MGGWSPGWLWFARRSALTRLPEVVILQAEESTSLKMSGPSCGVPSENASALSNVRSGWWMGDLPKQSCVSVAMLVLSDQCGNCVCSV